MRTLLPLCFLLLACATVQADPMVITGGTATITGDTTSFTVFGDGFSASLGGHGFTNFGCQDGCSPGFLISLGGSSGSMGPTDVSGFLNLGGTMYFTANTGVAFIAFTAPLVSVPATGEDTITLTSPFHMDAQFPTLGQFIGDGTATMVLHRMVGSSSGYFSSSVSYVFTSPVPEPTSLILLSIGIAGVGIRKLKKASG